MSERGLFFRLIASSAALAFLAVGCGGSEPETSTGEGTQPSVGSAGDSDTGDSDTGDSGEGDSGATDSSLGDLGLGEAPPIEFYDGEDAKIRFVNNYHRGGEPQAIDAYFGMAKTGELAAEIAPGETTEWIDVRLERDPVIASSDGSEDVRMSLQEPGSKELDAMLFNLDQSYAAGARWTVVLGADKAFTPGEDNPLITQLIDENEVAEPPTGKALVALNDVGLRGVDGGDFVTPSPVGQCEAWAIDNSIATGNAGTGYVVDPGALKVAAYDANTSCATGTPPVDLAAEAGKAYVLVASGSTLEDRKLTVLPLGEG